MTTNLFRSEAVEAQSERNVFGTTLVLPPGFSAYVMLVVALALAILALLFYGHYSPKDTVRGYIRTTEADVKVFAQSDGTIEEILVADGDRVVAGQRLMLLGTSRHAARPPGTSESIVLALRAEQQSIASEIAGTREAFAAKKAAYEEELQSLRRRLELVAKQRETLLESAGIAEREVERLARIRPSDLVSDSDVDRARAVLVEARLRLRRVEIESDDVRANMRRNSAALSEHPHLVRSRIAEKEAQLRRLAARIAAAQAVTEQAVVAPSAGIVSGLLVRKGQTVTADRPLLSLVPAEGEFYAELLIPTRTIGFIRPGAPVKLRYDAFPYQKFGVFDGVVDYVARTTTMPGDKPFPLPVTEAVYLARVSGIGQSVPGARARLPLQSGMTLTADIERDRRRVIEWLFDPLISAGRRL